MKDISYILKLQKQNEDQKLKARLQEANHKSRQDLISQAVMIVSEKMKADTLAAFGIDIKQ